MFFLLQMIENSHRAEGEAWQWKKSLAGKIQSDTDLIEVG